MDLGLIIGIFGTLLTIISLIYAIIVTQRNVTKKSLEYECLSPVPMTSSISKESSNSIKIIFTSPKMQERVVDNIVIQFIRLTNFGKIPMRREDLIQNDPLRIEVEGENVLDISIAKVSRNACQISIGPILLQGETTISKIDFEFLDLFDGALIQIISENRPSKPRLFGTIIGMPKGIREREVPKSSRGISNAGCIIPLLIQILFLAAVPFIYFRLNNSWDGVWMLLIPIAALIIPLILVILFLVLIEFRDKKKHPMYLDPPEWYFDRINWFYHKYYSE